MSTTNDAAASRPQVAIVTDSTADLDAADARDALHRRRTAVRQLRRRALQGQRRAHARRVLPQARNREGAADHRAADAGDVRGRVPPARGGGASGRVPDDHGQPFGHDQRGEHGRASVPGRGDPRRRQRDRRRRPGAAGAARERRRARGRRCAGGARRARARPCGAARLRDDPRSLARRAHGPRLARASVRRIAGQDRAGAAHRARQGRGARARAHVRARDRLDGRRRRRAKRTRRTARASA